MMSIEVPNEDERRWWQVVPFGQLQRYVNSLSFEATADLRREAKLCYARLIAEKSKQLGRKYGTSNRKVLASLNEAITASAERIAFLNMCVASKQKEKIDLEVANKGKKRLAKEEREEAYKLLREETKSKVETLLENGEFEAAVRSMALWLFRERP